MLGVKWKGGNRTGGSRGTLAEPMSIRSWAVLSLYRKTA